MKKQLNFAEAYPTSDNMQLFLVHPRVGKTRVIGLGKGMVLSMMFFFPLLAGVFYLGTQYGSRYVQPEIHLPEYLQPSSGADLDPQPRADTRLDALALRLGQLQSQLLRLNVIGQRVVEELDIGKDEFDFTEVPAMGGSRNELLDESQKYEDLMKQVDTFSMQIHDRELQLQTVSELLTNRELEKETLPSGRPVIKGYMTSTYGWRTDPFTGKRNFHSGVDFAGKRGADVIAVASGLVVWAGRDGGYGNLVAIDHGDGYVTRYAHNRDLTVGPGDRVSKGDTIAHMGSTGHSTGTHVHFEVMLDGKKVNPSKFIRKAG